MVKIRDDLPKTAAGDIDIEKWIARVCADRPAKEQALLTQAVNLNAAHGGFHLTNVNETCLCQGLLTADALISLEPDISTLLAAIVYFPALYGELSIEKIQESFNEEVAKLVTGVIDLTTRANVVSHQSRAQHDSLRKMLLAVVEDVRVVLLKLAERITSLRAASALSSEIRYEYALETRDIYAPLANRLGIGQIKWELEDFAFRYLEPQAYKQIAKLLDEKRLQREVYVNQVIEDVETSLKAEDIEAQITGRVKHIYSIWRKMRRKNVDFEDIYDVRAIRILVNEVRDCYAALGIVHSLWQHIPKEFDDYIATPKENGYRSLHTAVIGPEGRTLEIQIRTYDMHMEAELGVAAHWMYKEGAKHDVNYQKKLNALRQVLDWSEQIECEDANEAFLQEVLDDRVYVFTPTGDVIDLPKGATPLDFAYHIHTELGHRCRGAKVNGAIVPLNFELSSGQQIEVLSVKEGEPTRDWLNPNLGYLKSARSRSKVQAWFKRQAKDYNVEQGKVSLEKESKRMGFKMVALNEVYPKLGLKSLDDLYSAVGGQEVKIGQVLTVLQRIQNPEAESSTITPKAPTPSRAHSQVTIQGVGNLLSHFGKCCKPVPGDKIIGFITLGRGITIHRQDCLNTLNKPDEDHRLIQVEWGGTGQSYYPVDVSISAYDRQGLLKDITAILSNERMNVIGINTFTNKSNNIAELVLTLEIPDLNALRNILDKIMQLPNVLEAKRFHQESRNK